MRSGGVFGRQDEGRDMSRQHHYLKTVNPFFNDMSGGKKNFEVRFNDRNYNVGDVLHLQEFIPPETLTGKELQAEVMYLLDDERFCKPGYVVMGLDIFWRNFWEASPC
jgi:hypothetical protein